MNRARVAALCMGATLAASIGMLIVPRLALTAQPTEETVRVRLTSVTLGQIEQTVCLTGRLRGTQEFAGIAPETGRIAQIYVSAGDQVRKGEALFRMDTSLHERAMTDMLRRQESTKTAAGEAVQRIAAELAIPTEATVAAQLNEEVSVAEQALEGCIVRAQADGVVAQVTGTPLSMAVMGTPVVLLSGKEQQVTCNAVVRDASRLAAGMPVRLAASGDALCGGVIASISAATVDNLTGQTVCEVIVTPDTAIDLPLGASVSAEVILFHREQVPVIPVSAVCDDGTVWWAADGRCYSLPVTVAVSDEMNCWVDLPVGTEIIDGAPALVEGQRIRGQKK